MKYQNYLINKFYCGTILLNKIYQRNKKLNFQNNKYQIINLIYALFSNRIENKK